MGNLAIRLGVSRKWRPELRTLRSGVVAAILALHPQVTDPELISAAIEASALPARRFASRLMGRDERTIRRWATGEIAIPPAARAWLERWLELSDDQRRRIIGALDR